MAAQMDDRRAVEILDLISPHSPTDARTYLVRIAPVVPPFDLIELGLNGVRAHVDWCEV